MSRKRGDMARTWMQFQLIVRTVEIKLRQINCAIQRVAYIVNRHHRVPLSLDCTIGLSVVRAQSESSVRFSDKCQRRHPRGWLIRWHSLDVALLEHTIELSLNLTSEVNWHSPMSLLDWDNRLIHMEIDLDALDETWFFRKESWIFV